MEYITLIGIVIIVVGFAFKLDVLATVIISGIVTGLVSGMNIIEILEILGSSFVSNRLMSIFLIIFPVIAIIERYGLKERAAYLIGKLKTPQLVKCCYLFHCSYYSLSFKYQNWGGCSIRQTINYANGTGCW